MRMRSRCLEQEVERHIMLQQKHTLNYLDYWIYKAAGFCQIVACLRIGLCHSFLPGVTEQRPTGVPRTMGRMLPLGLLCALIAGLSATSDATSTAGAGWAAQQGDPLL